MTPYLHQSDNLEPSLHSPLSLLSLYLSLSTTHPQTHSLSLSPSSKILNPRDHPSSSKSKAQIGEYKILKPGTLSWEDVTKSSSILPLTSSISDVSNIRQVPDHQEVFVDPARDESLVIELLDLKHDVADNGSATWFLQDLALEQDAEGSVVIEQSAVFEAEGLRFRNMPAVITTAVGQMAISKGRQGREAQNIVKVYLANLRLKEVATDLLITAYEPVFINPFSETASTVGAGIAVPAAQTGRIPMAEVFKLAVSTFEVNDWSLFGAPAT